jgi:hypothetical protein
MPDEIIFRRPIYLPYTEAVYRLDIGDVLRLTPDRRPIAYKHAAISEIFQLVDSQARRIVALENDISKLQKQLYGKRR